MIDFRLRGRQVQDAAPIGVREGPAGNSTGGGTRDSESFGVRRFQSPVPALPPTLGRLAKAQRLAVLVHQPQATIDSQELQLAIRAICTLLTSPYNLIKE